MDNKQMDILSDKLNAFLLQHPGRKWNPHQLEANGVLVVEAKPKNIYFVEFKNDKGNKNAMSVLNFMEENGLAEGDLI